MESIEYRITEKNELAKACMPFIKNGGLFIKTSLTYPLGTELDVSLKLLDEPEVLHFIGKVVWITPKHEQNQMPEGVGLQFNETQAPQIRQKIEALLPEAFSMNKKEELPFLI